MPDSRMELMCEYLTRAGKEKQAQCAQAHNHSHCAQQLALSSRQMEFIVELLVNISKARGRLYGAMTFSRQDWSAITATFNENFGGKTKLSVLECAMRNARYKYVTSVFRERCKVAKEEQPELGEEYWHWMEV
ncbi:MAG: hypothetical protein Q9175_005179 [Cornicularia normoerica]